MHVSAILLEKSVDQRLDLGFAALRSVGEVELGEGRDGATPREDTALAYAS